MTCTCMRMHMRNARAAEPQSPEPPAPPAPPAPLLPASEPRAATRRAARQVGSVKFVGAAGGMDMGGDMGEMVRTAPA